MKYLLLGFVLIGCNQRYGGAMAAATDAVDSVHYANDKLREIETEIKELKHQDSLLLIKFKYLDSLND